jgi:hypothetical protein
MEERPIKKAGPMEERIIGFLRADVLQLNDRGGLHSSARQARLKSVRVWNLEPAEMIWVFVIGVRKP